ESCAVSQNYPNPFNPTTALPLSLDKNARVSVKIFDATGRLVSSEDYELGAGEHTLPVNGSAWATGTYFARVSTSDYSQTVKMHLIK
ncbi:MAG: T9SS type A sorting domain-containing protein, partial [bacterium]|nr:T9SS type A sorting domain-containing protein [bacterium]